MTMAIRWAVDLTTAVQMTKQWLINVKIIEHWLQWDPLVLYVTKW